MGAPSALPPWEGTISEGGGLWSLRAAKAVAGGRLAARSERRLQAWRQWTRPMRGACGGSAGAGGVPPSREATQGYYWCPTSEALPSPPAARRELGVGRGQGRLAWQWWEGRGDWPRRPGRRSGAIRTSAAQTPTCPSALGPEAPTCATRLSVATARSGARAAPTPLPPVCYLVACALLEISHLSLHLPVFPRQGPSLDNAILVLTSK